MLAFAIIGTHSDDQGHSYVGVNGDRMRHAPREPPATSTWIHHDQRTGQQTMAPQERQEGTCVKKYAYWKASDSDGHAVRHGLPRQGLRENLPCIGPYRDCPPL